MPKQTHSSVCFWDCPHVLGPTPVKNMNQTALVEETNEGTTSIDAEYFAEVTDLYYLLISGAFCLTAEGQFLLLNHFTISV